MPTLDELFDDSTPSLSLAAVLMEIAELRKDIHNLRRSLIEVLERTVRNPYTENRELTYRQLYETMRVMERNTVRYIDYKP